MYSHSSLDEKGYRKMCIIMRLLLLTVLFLVPHSPAFARRLTPKNIKKAIQQQAPAVNADPMRPAFHLTPHVGCRGDPNGGIYEDGWMTVDVDLSKFAGSEVSMSLFNLANGWHDEAGYWASIKVVAE